MQYVQSKCSISLLQYVQLIFTVRRFKALALLSGKSWSQPLASSFTLLNNDHFFKGDRTFADLTACKGIMNGLGHELQMQSTEQLVPDKAFETLTLGS